MAMAYDIVYEKYLFQFLCYLRAKKFFFAVAVD